MVKLGLFFPCLGKYIPRRAMEGLWAGKGIMFGHRITFSNKKTKRTWKPNVQRKEYYSDILERTVRVKVTTAAMRWIDKAGGFDPYIYHTPDKKLSSKLGSILKQEMRNKVESSDGIVQPPPRATRTQKRPVWWNEEYDKKARELRSMKLDFLPKSTDVLPAPPPECRAV